MAVFFAALGLLTPVACAFGELMLFFTCVENVESRFSKTTKTPIKHCVVSKVWKHYTGKWLVMLMIPLFLEMIWIGNRIRRDVCVCVCVCVWVYTCKCQYWWLLKKTCENTNFFCLSRDLTSWEAGATCIELWDLRRTPCTPQGKALTHSVNINLQQQQVITMIIQLFTSWYLSTPLRASLWCVRAYV